MCLYLAIATLFAQIATLFYNLIECGYFFSFSFLHAGTGFRRYVQKWTFLPWEIFTGVWSVTARLVDTRPWKQSNIILPFLMFCRCWCICWHLNTVTSWIVKSQALVSVFNFSLPNWTFGGLGNFINWFYCRVDLLWSELIWLTKATLENALFSRVAFSSITCVLLFCTFICFKVSICGSVPCSEAQCLRHRTHESVPRKDRNYELISSC